jgi:hypothetical protein
MVVQHMNQEYLCGELFDGHAGRMRRHDAGSSMILDPNNENA